MAAGSDGKTLCWSTFNFFKTWALTFQRFVVSQPMLQTTNLLALCAPFNQTMVSETIIVWTGSTLLMPAVPIPVNLPPNGIQVIMNWTMFSLCQLLSNLRLPSSLISLLTPEETAKLAWDKTVLIGVMLVVQESEQDQPLILQLQTLLMHTSGLSLQVNLMAALKLFLTDPNVPALITCAVPKTVSDLSRESLEPLKPVVGLIIKSNNLLPTVFDSFSYDY